MAFTRPKASQINFDTTNITDSLIRINSAETGNNTNDLGIVFERGNHTNAAIVWDESADTFRLISTTHDASSATSDINISAHHNLHVGGLETTGNVSIGGNLTVSGTTTTVDVASINITNSFSFEGATPDGFETTLTVADPTADRTITLPDVTGYAAILQSDPGTTLITATVAELNYVDGVTSNIQTQLDAKLALAGGTMSGAIAMGTNKITGMGDPAAAQDAATKAYVDSEISSNAVTTTGTATLTNKSLTAPIITGSSSAAGSILFKEDTDNGTNAVTLIGPASTADVTVTLPAATDTLIGKATTDTLTNKTINGPDNTLTNIANSSLSNSAITVARQGGNSTAISLGGTITFTNVSNETSVAEDSGTITIGLPATVAITTGLTVGGDTATTNTATQTLTNKTLTSPALTTPTVTTSITLNAQADLKFADADSSHYVAFQAPNTVGSNVTWTLPSADGTENQVLSTNGSGSLAWADAGSGSSLSGSSFPNSTISAMPGSAGDYDLGKNAAQDTAESPFEAGDSDAFGVNLGTVYSMMDPAGTTTTVDLGTLS
jgi:hypothetical protein